LSDVTDEDEKEGAAAVVSGCHGRLMTSYGT